VLIQFCEATTDPKTQVKCIGTLECLAQHPGSIDINRVRVSPRGRDRLTGHNLRRSPIIYFLCYPLEQWAPPLEEQKL
jgi:hypothetical protein